MQLINLICLLLLSSLQCTESASIFKGWFNSTYKEGSKPAGEAVIAAKLSEPEPEKVISLNESVDPVHHNFIGFVKPVPDTGEIISESADDRDPMEMISTDSTLGDRVFYSASRAVLLLSDFIEHFTKSQFGPSQYSDSESDESDCETTNVTEATSAAEATNIIASNVVDNHTDNAPITTDDNEAFEVVSETGDLDIAEID